MGITTKNKSNNRLFYYILIGLALGVIVGQSVYSLRSKETATVVAENIRLLGNIFIRLIQMIVAPLVFCTIVVGISKMGYAKMVGRVGAKAMLWFITASLTSLLIGLVWVNLTQPGAGAKKILSTANSSTVNELLDKGKSLSLTEFVNHVVPKSLFEALANNEILQILVFALASFGEKGAGITRTLDVVAHVILKMVGYIMWVAPVAVFGTIAAAVAIRIADIQTLWSFLISLYGRNDNLVVDTHFRWILNSRETGLCFI